MPDIAYPLPENAATLASDVLTASLVSPRAWYHVCFLPLSVLAAWPTKLEWRFLYAFFLVDFFRLPEGNLMIQSVYVGGPNLLRSAKGGLVILLMVASITWMYFQDTALPLAM